MLLLISNYRLGKDHISHLIKLITAVNTNKNVYAIRDAGVVPLV